MTGADLLEDLEAFHQDLTGQLDAGLDSLDLPGSPLLDGVALNEEDVERAKLVLATLGQLQTRVSGLQTRVAGELAGMRRTRPDPARPAPRAVDTTL